MFRARKGERYYQDANHSEKTSLAVNGLWTRIWEGGGMDDHQVVDLIKNKTLFEKGAYKHIPSSGVHCQHA